MGKFHSNHHHGHRHKDESKDPFAFAVNNDDAVLIYRPGTPTRDIIRKALELAKQHNLTLHFEERGLHIYVGPHDDFTAVRQQIRYGHLRNNSPVADDHIKSIGPNLKPLTPEEEADAQRIYAAIAERMKTERQALKQAPRGSAPTEPRKKSKHSGRKGSRRALAHH